MFDPWVILDLTREWFENLGPEDIDIESAADTIRQEILGTSGEGTDIVKDQQART